jgi:hypothetical protein
MNDKTQKKENQETLIGDKSINRGIFLQTIKGGGFGVLFISLLIANFIKDIIYNFFGVVKYNMFLDGFYISKFLVGICIYVISFAPTYCLVKSIRNRFS